MTTAFDSFQASPLGAFVQSPLDARGIGTAGSIPCTVFALDAVLEDPPTTWQLQLRAQGSGLLSDLPTWSAAFARDGSGVYQGSANLLLSTQFVVSQSFLSGTVAVTCNGGSSVALTDGGEIRIVRGGRPLSTIPEWRYALRFWELAGPVTFGDLTRFAPCAGDGISGRWAQSVQCGPLVALRATPRSIFPQASNLASRQLLSGDPSLAFGIRVQIDTGNRIVPTNPDASGMVLARWEESASLGPWVWELRRGGTSAVADGLTWYSHAEYGEQVFFSWPPTQVNPNFEETYCWMTGEPGGGYDSMGRLNLLAAAQQQIQYRAFELS